MLRIDSIRNIKSNEQGLIITRYKLNKEYPNLKYIQDLAPSSKLLRVYKLEEEERKLNDFKTVTSDFFINVYVPLYLEEISKNKRALEYLEKLSKTNKPGVIGCFCKEEKFCHRSIVAGILQGMGQEIQNCRDYSVYYKIFMDFIKKRGNK